MDVTAVLLAGGRSVRMGREKPLLEVGGEALVERHVRQLRSVGVRQITTVCNPENEAGIRQITGTHTILQRLPGMSGAVLAGLGQVCDAAAVFLVCVNDLILDEDYAALARAAEELACATCTLDRRFHGGMLQLEGNRICSIVEKPAGGCPPGAAANIMIHRIRGPVFTRILCERLQSGEEYETAITKMIRDGLHAVAVPVRFWLPIKTPEDYAAAQCRFSRNACVAPESR